MGQLAGVLSNETNGLKDAEADTVLSIEVLRTWEMVILGGRIWNQWCTYGLTTLGLPSVADRFKNPWEVSRTHYI